MKWVNFKAYSSVLHDGLPLTTIVGGLLSRFFIAMASLGFLAMYTQAGYSYALAGVGIGIVQISNCVIAPQVSRLVDRYGQSKIVPAGSAVGMGALFVVLLIVHFRGPLIGAYLCSVFVGFTPSATSLTRARWSYLFRMRGTYDPVRLRTAYSFEGVLDDISFMLSPALAIAFSAWFFPEAGLMLGLLTYIVGIVLVIWDKKTEPDVGFMSLQAQAADSANNTGKRMHNALFDYPIVAVFFVSMMCFGLLFGFLDLSTYSYCAELGNEEIASLVFMVSSFFSVTCGFVFGMIYLKATPLKQVIAVGGAVAVLYAPMMFVSNIPALFAAHILGAFSYAPFIITLNSTVERAVPSHRVTECLTWMVAGMQLGLAVAPTIAGLIIDSVGSQTAFLGVSVSGICIPVLFLLSLPMLRAGLSQR